jgi:hypothetical protein
MILPARFAVLARISLSKPEQPKMPRVIRHGAFCCEKDIVAKNAPSAAVHGRENCDEMCRYSKMRS